MNKYRTTCNPQRIQLFLDQKLSDVELSALESHLNDCDDCRRRLETTVASEDLWAEMRESLRDEQLPPDGPQSGYSDSTGEDASSSQTTVLKLLAPTDDDRMIGRWGTYEVVGVVGTGGMGVVLKAFDAALNRYVAIKVLAPHLGNSGAAQKRFSREAQASAAVVHDNVIEIYGVSEAAGLPYLVMPYVRGPSLQRRLDDDGPMALAEILRVGMQAAAGLAAAHTQGLVHRDVKPANILLADGIERVKLTDFGLARAADDASLTKTGVIAGTPQYMSPEQARGEAIDQRSDLFSLGSVLYAMCTGRAPFRAETSYGVLRRITDEEPRPIREINPEIPEWLCQIVAKLMAKRPEDRFQSAEEVAKLLEECLAHVQQPTAVPLPKVCGTLRVPTNNGTRSVPDTFPHRRKTFVLGTLAMLTLIGISLFAMGVVSTNPPDIAGQWQGEGWGQVTLKQTAPGRYTGTYTDTVAKEKEPGKIDLKWSRIERRFNGTWSEGEDRFGDLSIRLADQEIRGALTTDAKSKINPATPRLADLTWIRSAASSAVEFPSEKSKVSLPPYRIEPPDVLQVELLKPASGAAVLNGRYLVRPDGTINLRQYGVVHTAGKTIIAARIALQKHLAKYFDSPDVSVEVAAFNSKVYYVIMQGPVLGDNVRRLPITGNETVLDAIAQINGLSQVSGMKIWIARPASNSSSKQQILPIDWDEIARGAQMSMNYQILPGDRLYIAETGKGVETGTRLKSGTQEGPTNPVPVSIPEVARSASSNGNGPAAASFVFGPMIERTLLVGDKNRCFFSLDRGEYVPSPTDFDPTDPRNASDFQRWLTANHVDIFVRQRNGRTVLVRSEMTVANFDAHVFDHPAVEQLNIGGFRQSVVKIPGIQTEGDSQDRQTYLFETRQELNGLLQITSTTNDPPGLKIRFKLVRPARGREKVPGAVNPSVGLLRTLPLPAGDGMAAEGANEPLENNGTLDVDTAHWTVPKSWVRKTPKSTMLQAEYAIPKAEGDKADGRLTVSQARGSVEDNIARWEGQFGTKVDKEQKETLVAGGIKITLVDLTGTFNDTMAPMAPLITRPDYRMLGAIFQLPGEEALHFVKCYGPKKTITDRADEIKRFLTSLKVGAEKVSVDLGLRVSRVPADKAELEAAQREAAAAQNAPDAKPAAAGPENPFGGPEVPQSGKQAESPQARWVPPLEVAPPESRGRPVKTTPADLARFARLPEEQQKAAMIEGIKRIQQKSANVSLATTTCVSKVSGDPRKTGGFLMMLGKGEFGTDVYNLRRMGSSYRIGGTVSYPGQGDPKTHTTVHHDAESGINRFLKTERQTDGTEHHRAWIRNEGSSGAEPCRYGSYLGGLDFLGFPENDFFKLLLDHQGALRVRGIDQQSRLVEVSVTYTDEHRETTVSCTAWFDLGKDWMLRRRGLERNYRGSARAKEETYESFEVTESELFDGLWLPTKFREITWSSRLSFGNLDETTAQNIKIGSVKKEDLEIVFPAGTVVLDDITGDRWTVGVDEKAAGREKELP